eukprot:m.787422 g.787422  ORF g.787422 m.787422 type:complete len:80 (+) comp23309_c0_seq13:1684-1923(+)
MPKSADPVSQLYMCTGNLLRATDSVRQNSVVLLLVISHRQIQGIPVQCCAVLARHCPCLMIINRTVRMKSVASNALVVM